MESIKSKERRMLQIQKLKKDFAKRKITILGHDNIDVDAFLSGILLSKLFSFLKIENEFIILGEVKENETYNIVKELFNVDMKKWENVLEEDDRYLFLEDHFETIHSGKIVGCIDHHPTNQKVDYEYQYRRNSCACAYLIYEIMEQVGYQVTKEEAKMIIVAMMVDTTSFRSSKTIPEEVKVAQKLAAEYSLKYEELLEYCLCLTPINNMELKEIVENGNKHYDYSGTEVECSYVQLYGLPDSETINSWLEYLKYSIRTTNIKMKVFLIFEMKNNQTIEFIIDETEKVYVIVHKGILSRGIDIMPKIEEVFSKK